MRIYVVNYRDGFIMMDAYNSREKKHIVIEDGDFIAVDKDEIRDADIEKEN